MIPFRTAPFSTLLSGGLATALAVAIGAPALAAEDDSAAISLEDMARRLRELETANEGLRNEVRQLRSEDDEAWLDEERAAQIRGIVTDVLADAETRTSLQDAGLTAGYSDGFFIASPDGAFTMKIQGLLQTRFVWSHLGGSPPAANFPNAVDVKQDRTGWEIPEAQLTFSGTLWDSAVEYMVRAGFENNAEYALQSQSYGGNGFGNAQAVGTAGSGSGNFSLLDAWARVNFSQDWAVRIGQFKLPFDREFLIYDGYLTAASRSVLSNILSTGYSQGVEFEYFGEAFRWKFAFSDGGSDNIGGRFVSLVGSDPLNTPYYVEQADWALTSRIEFKLDGLWEDFRSLTSPRGDEFSLLVGGAVHYQQGRPWYSQGVVPIGSTGDDYNNWFGLTADVTAKFGGASLFGSFYFTNVAANAAEFGTNSTGGFGALNAVDAGSVNVLGFLIQGAVYVADDIELFAQYEYGNSSGPKNLLDRNAIFNDPDDLSLFTVGVNYYFKGQNAKWTTDLGFSFDKVSYFWADPAYGLRASDSTGQVLLRTQWQLFF